MTTWLPWGNVQGLPEMILLDADLEKTKIIMSNSELTKKTVLDALKAELRQKEIQPVWDLLSHWLR